MDENLSRGYVQLGQARRLNEFKSCGQENGFARISPPQDSYNIIYLSLLLAGAGFLLPYNSFVIAVDYFQNRYPKTTIMLDMSTVYIVTAFIAVLLNNVLVETLSLSTRITFGYLISFLTLNFVVICEIWWELFQVATSYTINLIAIAIVSFGCTVQQSSFYGYTSMLPTRYTQAVMAGESAAGFWVSLNRIVTKSMLDDERGNTSMFFMLSISTIVMCFVLQQRIYKTEFVQYYVTLCQERNRITLEPSEELPIDPFHDSSDQGRGQYGVLRLQTSPPGTDSGSGNVDSNGGGQYYEFSFSNPVYDPTAPTNLVPTGSGTTYKVEDIVITGGGSRGSTSSSTSRRLSGIKRGVLARLEVAKQIYPYMISIALAYAVTLSLYPGIVSEVMSCDFGSWMPVVLMTAFNGFDLLGKVLATLPVYWSRSQLLNFSCARMVIIPLFLLCAMPRKTPVFGTEWAPIALSALLGLTNGIVGSVPMVQAPSRVAVEHRELAGNIMTLSYTFGLTSGSMLAYTLVGCLGPRVTLDEICRHSRSLLYPTGSNPDTYHNASDHLNYYNYSSASSASGSPILSTLASVVTKATKKVKTNKMSKLKTTTIASLLSTVLVAGTSDTASQLLQHGTEEIYRNMTSTVIPHLLENVTAISNEVLRH